MQAIPLSILMLVLSNGFMTFAWYAHLRNLNDRPWWIAALASWGIPLFEYLLTSTISKMPSSLEAFEEPGRGKESMKSLGQRSTDEPSV